MWSQILLFDVLCLLFLYLNSLFNIQVGFILLPNGTKYSRMDEVKFVEDSLKKFEGIWSALDKPYSFKFFKGFLPQILLGSFFAIQILFILIGFDASILIRVEAVISREILLDKSGINLQFLRYWLFEN